MISPEALKCRRLSRLSREISSFYTGCFNCWCQDMLYALEMLPRADMMRVLSRAISPRFIRFSSRL